MDAGIRRNISVVCLRNCFEFNMGLMFCACLAESSIKLSVNILGGDCEKLQFVLLRIAPFSLQAVVDTLQYFWCYPLHAHFAFFVVLLSHRACTDAQHSSEHCS